MVGILATLALLLMTPATSDAFMWTLVSFVALIVMHGVYWAVTHPVNKFWLKDQDLKGVGVAIFKFDPLKRQGRNEPDSEEVWKRFRDRWEYSHIVRAILAALALVALTVAIAL